MIFNALKDLATKDPEKTKEFLNGLKAKADAMTPEDRQKLMGTFNDLKTKAMTPEDRQKLLGTFNDLKSKALMLTDEQRTKIAEAIRKSDGT